MKSIKRFRTFEELKACESRAEAQEVILRRHLAFEKLVAFIRSHVVRKSGTAKS